MKRSHIMTTCPQHLLLAVFLLALARLGAHANEDPITAGTFASDAATAAEEPPPSDDARTPSTEPPLTLSTWNSVVGSGGAELVTPATIDSSHPHEPEEPNVGVGDASPVLEPHEEMHAAETEEVYPQDVLSAEAEKQTTASDAVESRESAAPETGCPGVCVAERISDHCEAALDVDGLCKPFLRCCVPHNLFEGKENVPSEFVIIKGPKTNRRDPSNASKDDLAVDTNEVTRQTGPEESVRHPPPAELNIPEHKRCKGTCVAAFFSFLCDEVNRDAFCPRNGRCCLTQRRKKPDPAEGDVKETPSSIPTSPESTTPTTSTSVKTTTPPPPRTPPRTPPPTTTTSTSTTTTTTTPSTTTTTTSTTTTPAPKPTTQPPSPTIYIPECPGTCIPVDRIQLCRTPSHVITRSTCVENTICCDDREAQKQWKQQAAAQEAAALTEAPERTETSRPPRPTRRPPPSYNPVSSFMPQAIQSLASFFMSSDDRPPSSRPRPPNRRRPLPPNQRHPSDGHRPLTTPITTTTTTTTTTTPAPTTTTPKPDCPGTCIPPILSFTCFGNAELTQIFACDRPPQKCCAPKSDIRDLERQAYLLNPPINDSAPEPEEESFEIQSDDSQFNPDAQYGNRQDGPHLRRPPHFEGHQNPHLRPQYYQEENVGGVPFPGFLHEGHHQAHFDQEQNYNVYNPEVQGSVQPPYESEHHYQHYQGTDRHDPSQAHPEEHYQRFPQHVTAHHQLSQGIPPHQLHQLHHVEHYQADTNFGKPPHQPGQVMAPPPPPLQPQEHDIQLRHHGSSPDQHRLSHHEQHQPLRPSQAPRPQNSQPSEPRPTHHAGPLPAIPHTPLHSGEHRAPSLREPQVSHIPPSRVPSSSERLPPPLPVTQEPKLPPVRAQTPPRRVPVHSQSEIARPAPRPAPAEPPRPQFIPPTPPPQPPQPTSTVDSLLSMMEEPVSTSSKYVCGLKGTDSRRSGRVVGGEDALPGEWCWQVALINSQNQYLCGGALIGTQWVLTAAHCVTNIVRSGDSIYVRVGDHDLTTRFGSPGAQTLRVATTYIHHNHNSQTLDNDIALLKLSGHAELKKGVCLVCLPARGVSQQAGKRCTVTGYGYMGETGPIPLRVREAEVPIVSENECVRKINAVTEKIFILPASSFCAGGESGHDACQGDGGGPLVCEVDGFYEVSGLVSWGFGCGRHEVPGVYVKVSSFIGWINQIISVNNHSN